MNTGKLTEAAEERSVIRILGKKGIEPVRVVTKELSGGHKLVLATEETGVEYECQSGFLLDQILGLLAAEGVWNPALVVSVSIPASWEETDLKKLTRNLRESMKQREIEDYTVRIRVQEELRNPVLTVSGSGISGTHEIGRTAGDRPHIKTDEQFTNVRTDKLPEFAAGASIIMAGYAALEATACIISAKRELLMERLPVNYLDGGMKAALRTDMRPAIRLAGKQGALVKTAGEGGIFTALWELGRYLDSGMTVWLREIPLLQETIEVCEVLDVNPYLMLSTGSILAVTEQPEELLDACREMDIPAAKIGVLTGGHDRVLVNGEERRFLEPFRGDEIYKTGILQG